MDVVSMRASRQLVLPETKDRGLGIYSHRKGNREGNAQQAVALEIQVVVKSIHASSEQLVVVVWPAQSQDVVRGRGGHDQAPGIISHAPTGVRGAVVFAVLGGMNHGMLLSLCALSLSHLEESGGRGGGDGIVSEVWKVEAKAVGMEIVRRSDRASVRGCSIWIRPLLKKVERNWCVVVEGETRAGGRASAGPFAVSVVVVQMAGGREGEWMGWALAWGACRGVSVGARRRIGGALSVVLCCFDGASSALLPIK
jgi:hypothetical protein